ncbi:MMPL family transporter [Marinitoga lauensis]|uniref:MMPL family transporter n=1 Tax=Marinitoga lauensis TaxID=2201189 RepID=UPI001011A857|nr:MMPL family transporter [Marinitoga lauensis]
MEFISKNIFILTPDYEQEFLKKIYSSNNLEEFFKALKNMFEEPKSGYNITEQDRKQYEYILKSFSDFLNGINSNDPELIIDNLENMLFGQKYLISKDGKFGMIIIRPTISSNDIEKVVKLVNNIEEIVKERSRKYNVNAGLTGTLVIARDEMVVSERDMTVATIVSMILILIIFILGFRSLKYMILSVIPLILGIIWALGFTKITIGSLNIMTIMMGAILAGLGIDYSIHIISLFIELKSKGFSTSSALKGVFEKILEEL